MAAGLTFEWGRRDCVTLAADRYMALTGTDAIADVRGVYSSAFAAARLLRREGGMAAAIDRRIAWPRRPAEAALIALLPGAQGDVLAVRRGRFWVMPSEEGEARVRDDMVTPLAAWGPA